MPDLNIRRLVTETYTTTGSVESWTVPPDVSDVTITITGAQGSTGSNSSGHSGGGGAKGGKAVGTLSVTPGTTYYYYLGTQTEGGNGGTYDGDAGNGGKGGGKSWFSVSNSYSAADVVIVGGGGGGGGGACTAGVNSSNGGGGGSGGGTTGNDGGDASIGGGHGHGGTQVGGGAGGGVGGGSGSDGTGGSGGSSGSNPGYNHGGGGGGGAGYYGGGGGGTQVLNDNGAGAGGGGGSSYMAAGLSSTSTTADSQTGTGVLTLDYYINVVYDTVSETESTDIKIKYSIDVNDSVTVTDSISVTRRDFVFVDTNATLTTSNYKWMTSTLLNAQQSNALRPYTKCYIVDDDIYPAQILTNPGQPLNGQVVTAPDGNLLVVGTTKNSDLGFWKITDGSDISQWQAAENVTLALSGNFRLDTNAVINVSDWYQGTYIIDVYYWRNILSKAEIGHKRSIDGGATFSESCSIGSTGIASNTTGNLCLSAGKPLLQSDNTVSAIFFYTDPTNLTQNWIRYSQYPGTGTSFGGNILWSDYEVNTSEWVLHSVDSFYDGSKYIIVFSGYHNLLENSKTYGLYLTQILKLAGAANKDIWSRAIEILPSLSSSYQNSNNFTLPRLNYDGTYLWLTFKAITTDTVKEDGSVTNSVNFFSCYSKDFLNFTYPLPYVFTDGSAFPMQYPSDTTDYTNAYRYSFAHQGSNYFLAGSGMIWQYTRANVVADVSDYILGYDIAETAGGPSTITMRIGNQNGQWFGPAPSLTGWQAIEKNKKIFLYQGYYNSSNVGEVIPKTTYFIDDIQSQIRSNNNTLAIKARDVQKKLRITTSRFAYNMRGPDYYIDTFDGSTIGNWNQLNGGWIQSGSTFQTASTPVVNVESRIILTGINVLNGSSISSVIVKIPGTTDEQTTYYPLWIDQNNWVRIRFVGTGGANTSWYLEKCLWGSVIIMDSDSYGMGYTVSTPYMLLWTRFTQNFYFNFFWSTCSTIAGSEGLGVSRTLFTGTNTPSGIYNLSGIAESNVSTVALGCVGFAGAFANFKFCQFGRNESEKEVIKYIGSKAAIFDYKTQNVEDY